MKQNKMLIPAERIENSILLIRGKKVLLDADIASLYHVETRALIQAVKRNIVRFPEDFMFQLEPEEFQMLKSRSVNAKRWGGRRYPPFAFTEQGVAMLSSVINSSRAVMVNIEIMRTFVRLRNMLATHENLSRKIEALEKKYDVQFRAVFEAIRQLMTPPKPKKNQVGFHWQAKEQAKPPPGKPPGRKKAPSGARL